MRQFCKIPFSSSGPDGVNFTFFNQYTSLVQVRFFSTQRKFSLSTNTYNSVGIRPARSNDLKTIFHWIEREGWNPGLYDLQSYRAVDPYGFNVLWLGDEPVSTLLSVRYPYDYAFLGLYIVKFEYRGHGYGKSLWDSTMKQIGDYKTIGLNAVLDQIPSYQKSEFVFSHYNTRWQRGLFNGVLEAENKQKEYEVTRKISLYEIIELDYAASACYRPGFWKSTIASPSSYFLAAKHKGQVIGFGLVLRCANGYKIGPLYAEAPEIANDLLVALWDHVKKNGCKPTDTIQIDTSETNGSASHLATKYGFTRVYDTARMYRGEKPVMRDDIVYSLPSLEIG